MPSFHQLTKSLESLFSRQMRTQTLFERFHQRKFEKYLFLSIVSSIILSIWLYLWSIHLIDLISFIFFIVHWIVVSVALYSFVAAVLTLWMPRYPNITVSGAFLILFSILCELFHMLTRHRNLSDFKKQRGPPISCSFFWETDSCREYYANTSIWYYNVFRVSGNLILDIVKTIADMIGSFFGTMIQKYVDSYAWYFQLPAFGFIGVSIIFLVALIFGIQMKLTTPWASLSFSQGRAATRSQTQSPPPLYSRQEAFPPSKRSMSLHNPMLIVKESLQRSSFSKYFKT